jgi:hypothetical protein
MGQVWRGSASLAVGAKWAISVHSTSDELVEGNIAVDFPGAGIATEDGNEVRNMFRKNAALYSLLAAFDLSGTSFPADANINRNAPGVEGTGFWLHGTMNYFEGNEAWNNLASGINLFNQQQPAGIKYPSAPGMMPDTLVNHFTDKPLSFIDNISIANVGRGRENWATPAFPDVRSIAANSVFQQYGAIESEGIEVHLIDAIILGEVGVGDAGAGTGIGIHSSIGYVGSFVLEGTPGHGAKVVGCTQAIGPAGSISGIVLKGNVTLQCQVNIPVLGTAYVQGDGTIHKKLRDYPERFIVLGVDTGGVLVHWDGVGPLPPLGISLYRPALGSPWSVANWQGTGEDYQLLTNESLGTNLSWYSYYGTHSWNTPVKGLTMQQSWDRYGLSVWGDVLDPSDAVPLVGIINGVGRKGLHSTKFAQPRAVFSFPTMEEPASVHDGGLVTLISALTGDPNPALATTVMWYSLDGEPPVAYDRPGTTDRSFYVSGTHAASGTHTLEVWRVDPSGLEVPGSRTKGGYFVGIAPPPPPPPTTVPVPNVIGMTQSAADAALIAAQLVAGLVTTLADPAPVGQVTQQSPAAGALVPIGTAVSLMVSSGPALPPLPVWEVVAQLTLNGAVTREIKRLKVTGGPDRYALHDPVLKQCVELMVGPDPGCD